MTFETDWTDTARRVKHQKGQTGTEVNICMNIKSEICETSANVLLLRLLLIQTAAELQASEQQLCSVQTAQEEDLPQILKTDQIEILSNWKNSRTEITWFMDDLFSAAYFHFMVIFFIILQIIESIKCPRNIINIFKCLILYDQTVATQKASVYNGIKQRNAANHHVSEAETCQCLMW